ncbi:MAG: YggT family protein [Gemella sp.]|nr:YggT family protein [Gemella sp.]
MDSVWLINFVAYTFGFYRFALIIFILSSWFPGAKENFIIKFLEDICEPYLALFRKILPPIATLDFSPIVAIFALDILERVILSFITGTSIF